MLNARRSALYVAIIGLGLAAGEASAACPTGYKSVTTYTAGYKVTVCQRVGSDIVGVDVQPDGGEGGSPLVNPVVQASVTGATIDGGEGPSCEVCITSAPSSFMFASFTQAKKKPKPPKAAKCYIYVPDDGDDDDDGDTDEVRKVKVDCTEPVTLEPGDSLTYPGTTNPVTEFFSPTEEMKCKGEGPDQICSREVTIGATDETGQSYECPNGGYATNIVPIPPFVTTVNIDYGAIVVHIGCYEFDVGGGPGIVGSPYLCEDLPDWNGTCGTGAGPVYNTYCITDEPPVVEASCTVPSI